MVEKRECPKCGGTLKEIEDSGRTSKGLNIVFCNNKNYNYYTRKPQSKVRKSRG